MTNRKKFDIYDRAFNFAVKVANLLDRLPKNITLIEYSRQLIKSSGSVGANIEEADGTLTKKDFVNKVAIARREARESKHWLRLIKSVSSLKEQRDREESEWLINESTEITLILSSIIKNTKDMRHE